MSLRIVVGSDDAGYEYKEALKGDLAADSRVAEVTDVGLGADEGTAYPHVAVAAGRLCPPHLNRHRRNVTVPFGGGHPGHAIREARRALSTWDALTPTGKRRSGGAASMLSTVC